MEKNFESCLNNNPVSIKYRKSERTLYATGLGCMGYAIWSVIRTLLQTYFRYEDIKEFFNVIAREVVQVMDPSLGEDLIRLTTILTDILIIALMVVALVVSFLLRFYVGRSACLEAVGKKKRVIYIVFAVLILLFDIFSIYGAAREFGNMANGTSTEDYLAPWMPNFLDEVAELLLSITSVIIMLEMIVNAIRVKVFRKKFKGGSVNER
ncbi:MAG: hypothetical protein IIZ41_08945 [Lachnospiraceae bacterium]|jgi:hypothetical protein|nr:hypothetical protein [Lachnospiraceae bacterium]MBR3637311.1 hypothetical protein [Lachnospiraceae bacterium]